MSATIKSATRAADHWLGRLSGRRRVLVEARTPVYLAVLGPLINAFARDSRVDVYVTGGDSPVVRETVAAGAPAGVHWIEREDALWTRFDLLVNADPWGTVSLRRCRNRINFFHGVAGKYDLDCPAGMPAGFETYKAVGFANADRMQRYLAAGIVSPGQAVLVGYPKLDALVNGAYDVTAVRESLQLPLDRPTVLFGPTWSVASALHLAGEAIVEHLLDAGFNVIVKLHDRSLQTSERFTDGIDWRERLSRFSPRRGFAHAIGPDASPYLAAADIMVTDHSSVGFEFLVLDRPLIVYDAPDLAAVARINPQKIALLRSAATVVRTPAELVEAARGALVGPGALSEARRRVASDIFYRAGSATERALALCYSAMELTPTRLTPGTTAAHIASDPASAFAKTTAHDDAGHYAVARSVRL
jgi:hypothetical protein